MTDDEIREALRLDFEQTADWRRSKAAEHPEDSRNLEAAALLDKLAASVETVAPDLGSSPRQLLTGSRKFDPPALLYPTLRWAGGQGGARSRRSEELGALFT
jgi:hypothetical protein